MGRPCTMCRAAKHRSALTALAEPGPHACCHARMHIGSPMTLVKCKYRAFRNVCLIYSRRAHHLRQTVFGGTVHLQINCSTRNRRQTWVRTDGTQLSVYQTTLALVGPVHFLFGLAACWRRLGAPERSHLVSCRPAERHFTPCTILHVTCELRQAERHLRTFRLR